MKRTDTFEPEERRALAAIVRRGETAVCPRCGSPLDEWRVPPRPDVSYVRDRIWLVCSPCSVSVVVDRQGPEG